MYWYKCATKLFSISNIFSYHIINGNGRCYQNVFTVTYFTMIALLYISTSIYLNIYIVISGIIIIIILSIRLNRRINICTLHYTLYSVHCVLSYFTSAYINIRIITSYYLWILHKSISLLSKVKHEKRRSYLRDNSPIFQLTLRFCHSVCRELWPRHDKRQAARHRSRARSYATQCPRSNATPAIDQATPNTMEKDCALSLVTIRWPVR